MNSRQKAFLYLSNQFIEKNKENLCDVMNFLKSDEGIEFVTKFDSLDYLSLKHILGDHFMRWKQGMKGRYKEFG